MGNRNSRKAPPSGATSAPRRSRYEDLGDFYRSREVKNRRDKLSHSDESKTCPQHHPEAYHPQCNPKILARLAEAFGKTTQEIGYLTDGHTCIARDDYEIAKKAGSSLLYGEILPQGIVKLLDSRHLRAKDATKIYDLGMGTGKLAVQAFISYKNLKEIVGIEISPSRYSIGEAALRRMASKHPNKYTITKFVKGRTITLQTRKGKRKIRFDCGDLFTVTELHNVDIVFLETELPVELHPKLALLLSAVPQRARVLSYMDLRELWTAKYFPYEQIPINRSPHNRFLTSWSYVQGHHFFMWRHIPKKFPQELYYRPQPHIVMMRRQHFQQQQLLQLRQQQARQQRSTINRSHSSQQQSRGSDGPDRRSSVGSPLWHTSTQRPGHEEETEIEEGAQETPSSAVTSVQPVSPHPPSHETHADVAKAHSEPWPEAPAASAQPLQGTVRCLVPGDSAEEEEEAESDEEQSGEIQWGVASNREEAVRNRQHAIGTVANRGAGDPRPVETLSPSSQTEEKTPRSSARSLPRSGAVVANAGRSALVINSGMRNREDADGASTVTEPPESTETAGQTTLTTAGVWKYLGNTNTPKQIKVSHNYSGSSESGSLTSGSRSPNRTPASPVDTRGSRQPLAKQVKPAIRSFGTSSSTAGQSVVFLNASIRGDILHRTASESGKFRDHVAIRDSIGDLEVVNSRPPTGTSSTSHISNSATDESDF